MRFDPRSARRMWRAKALIGRAGRWTLVTFILCLALIGFLHMTRGTAVRHVHGVGADGVPIGVSEPQFPLVVTMLTGAWLASGNRVEVALNGDGTYSRLWDDLRSAQQSITLQLYHGQPGRMGHTLSRILRDRAAAGVRVTVGSMNFDNRSMALNDEATLMVLDRTVGQETNRIFLDDLQYAEEITTAGFRQRSWLRRMAERGANLITRLL